MSHSPTASSLTAAELEVVFPYGEDVSNNEEGGVKPGELVDNVMKALACYAVAACSYRVPEDETLLQRTYSNTAQVITGLRNFKIDPDGWRLGAAGILSDLGNTATGDVKLVPGIGPEGARNGSWFYIGPNIKPENMRPKRGIEMQVRFALLLQEVLSDGADHLNNTINRLEQYNDPSANKFGTLLGLHYDDPEATPRLVRLER